MTTRAAPRLPTHRAAAGRRPEASRTGPPRTARLGPALWRRIPILNLVYTSGLHLARGVGRPCANFVPQPPPPHFPCPGRARPRSVTMIPFVHHASISGMLWPFTTCMTLHNHWRLIYSTLRPAAPAPAVRKADVAAAYAAAAAVVSAAASADKPRAAPAAAAEGASAGYNSAYIALHDLSCCWYDPL